VRRTIWKWLWTVDCGQTSGLAVGVVGACAGCTCECGWSGRPMCGMGVVGMNVEGAASVGGRWWVIQ
jgi:hypothetical protein